MAGSKAARPTPRDIERQLGRLADAHPRMVAVESAGMSAEGRRILAATVAGPRTDPDDRQHALVVAGQHGNEEGGRMVALGLLDWLVSPGAAETRRKQAVTVVPCVNPDGAAADTHKAPSGVAPNRDHAPGGAESPEGLAVESLAERLQPELFADLHARGYAGCSYDMVLWPAARPYTEDALLLHEIALEMTRAGEAAGVPHVAHPLTWPGWGGDDFDGPSTTTYAYRRFKSMVFLTETAESDRHAIAPEARVASGLAKLKVLLARGNARHPKLHDAGYPVDLLAGSFCWGVVAVGATAAERRANRVAAWRGREAFARIDTCCPEPPDARRCILHVEGRPPAATVALQASIAGRRRVASVRLNGRSVEADPAAGWTSWQAPPATFVRVALPGLSAGRHELRVRFR